MCTPSLLQKRNGSVRLEGLLTSLAGLQRGASAWSTGTLSLLLLLLLAIAFFLLAAAAAESLFHIPGGASTSTVTHSDVYADADADVYEHCPLGDANTTSQRFLQLQLRTALTQSKCSITPTSTWSCGFATSRGFATVVLSVAASTA